MSETSAPAFRTPQVPGPHARRAVTRSWRELKVPLAPRDARAVAPLRHLAASALTGWCIEPGQADDVVLVLSELATNALIHTDDAVQIRMRRTAGSVVLEVADTSPHLPDFHAGPGHSARENHGYGLKLVVTTLADTVTVIKHPRCGKTIKVTFEACAGAAVTSSETRS